MISINNVTKSFTTSKQPLKVLDGLNLNIKAGETVAILGESGSGKTTLLGLLAGLDFVDSGEIVMAEHPIHKLSEPELAQFRGKNLGFVFQNFNLLKNMTALENVQVPLEILGMDSIEERALEALVDVGLGDRKDHYPRQLSGGECQRVAIARAIVHHPPILLADEPSGNLDEVTGRKVMDSLFDLIAKNSMTTLMVTHSEALAARCSRRVKLHQGQLHNAH